MIEATDATFAEVVLASERPVVVDFWAPWCRPCEAVERILAELEGVHAERLTFVKVDIDANPATAARYGVLSLPTTVVFEHGEPRAEVVGARPRRHYEQALAPWLSA